MKEKILQALKAKFEGVSEAVLGRYADKLAKTVKTEEGVATTVEGVTIQQVIDSYTDSRVTEGNETTLKNHRTKLGLDADDKPIVIKDPKKEEPIVEPLKDEPAWFKDYREAQEKKIADLEKIIEGDKAQKSNEARKESLIKKMKELGVDEAYIPLMVKNVVVDTDDKIETLATELHTDFNNLVQAQADKGVVINVPPGSSGGTPEGEAKAKSIAEAKNKNSSVGVEGKKI